MSVGEARPGREGQRAREDIPPQHLCLVSVSGIFVPRGEGKREGWGVLLRETGRGNGWAARGGRRRPRWEGRGCGGCLAHLTTASPGQGRAARATASISTSVGTDDDAGGFYNRGWR